MLKSDAFNREQMRRRIKTRVSEDSEELVTVATPGDTILAKLQWFEKGGRVSERQWRDVLGVLKLQGEALDRDYLMLRAGRLGLTRLLEKATTEAGHAP